MAVKNCPHCSFEIPPEFAVMPICSVCGGDINAQPKQVWSPVDIQAAKTYNCPECRAEIPSVLTTQCPACGVPLRLAETAAANEPAPVARQPEPAPVSRAAEPRPAPRSPAPSPPPQKEGFFARLLRMLGLKK